MLMNNRLYFQYSYKTDCYYRKIMYSLVNINI